MIKSAVLLLVSSEPDDIDNGSERVLKHDVKEQADDGFTEHVSEAQVQDHGKWDVHWVLTSVVEESDDDRVHYANNIYSTTNESEVTRAYEIEAVIEVAHQHRDECHHHAHRKAHLPRLL